MVHGETTTRSPFDADDLIARLRGRGVEQLRGESGIWVILDGSDIRKPYAQVMEGLQPVKRLSGGGMIPGYRTINAIGIGMERRGLLYHHLFSSTADDFVWAGRPGKCWPCFFGEKRMPRATSCSCR